MKKICTLLTVLAMLTANAGHAQSSNSGRPAPKPVTSNNSSDDFAWGIGLAALAVLGTVVGLTAATASSAPSTYSN